MLNNHNTREINHVKFVSYTGSYPNLCRGVLTLEIDGTEYKFGHDYRNYNWFNEDNYDSFWSSSGGLMPNYEGAYQEEWRIDVDDIPEQFQKYAVEIDEVFNDNVPWGCCGGCI